MITKRARYSLAGAKVLLDGPKLVACDRLFDGQPTLEPAHPYPSAVEIQFIAAHADGLADAQPVAVSHELRR